MRGAFRALGLLCRIRATPEALRNPGATTRSTRDADLCACPFPGGCYIWSHGDPLVKHKIVRRDSALKRYQSDREVTVKVLARRQPTAPLNLRLFDVGALTNADEL